MTSELVWIALREAGRKVAAATFPGADGLDIRIPGLANSPIVQRAAERTVDYTVPFGAFGGIGAQGFSLVGGEFLARARLDRHSARAGGPNVLESRRCRRRRRSRPSRWAASRTTSASPRSTPQRRAGQLRHAGLLRRASGHHRRTVRASVDRPRVRARIRRRSAPFYLEGSSSKAGVGVLREPAGARSVQRAIRPLLGQ